jgi:hypothetical protein
VLTFRFPSPVQLLLPPRPSWIYWRRKWTIFPLRVKRRIPFCMRFTTDFPKLLPKLKMKSILKTPGLIAETKANKYVLSDLSHQVTLADDSCRKMTLLVHQCALVQYHKPWNHIHALEAPSCESWSTVMLIFGVFGIVGTFKG